MAQSQMKHVLEEKLSQDSEDDNEGGPEDLVAHLHKQAAEMRRGETLDRFTAIHRL